MMTSRWAFVLLTITLISLGLRLSREPWLLTERSKCITHRSLPGDHLDAVACPVNASLLNAGVCVQLKEGKFCMPSLVIIGAMKSGTTNLMVYLAQHSQLATSQNALGWPLESRFFSRAQDTNATSRWRAYLRQFPQKRGKKMFDKSPNYMINPVVAQVLRRLAPCVKLVVTLRNPTTRAYSHFQHDCRNGRVVRVNGTVRRGRGTTALSYPCSPDDFDAMVADQLYEDCVFGDSNVVPRGFYACHLEQWLAVFPREQLLALIFERFVVSRHDTLDAIKQIEEFVGVTLYDYDTTRVRIVERVYNSMPSRQHYPPMLSTTKSKLDAIYREPNRRLSQLLPDALTEWHQEG